MAGPPRCLSSRGGTVGGASLARKSAIDYGRLLEVAERHLSAGNQAGEALRRAVEGAYSVDRDGPDLESIRRNLRRHWTKKHGPVREAEKVGTPRATAALRPGLGVLYDVLQLRLDAMVRDTGIPLTEQRRDELVAEARAMREALRRRKAALESLSQADCERLVRAEVIDVRDFDPAGLVAREIKAIADLLDNLDVTFMGSSMLHKFWA